MGKSGTAFRLGTGVLLVLAASGCDWMKPKPAPGTVTEEEKVAEQGKKLRRACSSSTTYDRLKELAFDEARRIRNVDSALLDQLAAATVVRMEEPLLKSRDEELNVTVCTGRLVVELPPGARDVFNGEQRLIADVEYAAQEATDGSGLVYQMSGAEPIIYRLAAIDLNRRPGATQMASADEPAALEARDGEAQEEVAAVGADETGGFELPVRRAPAPLPPPRSSQREPVERREPEPVRKPAPPREPAPERVAEAPRPRPATTASARPSFNCRHASTQSERMVCGSAYLAGKDRTMSSLFYGAIAAADPRTKARIRASRDGFLRRREQCGTEGCVAAVYDARIAELRDYGYTSD